MKYIPSSFFLFIRAAALGEVPPRLPPLEERAAALSLAKRYDLAPLLAEAMLSAGLDEGCPDYDAFLREQLKGVLRYTRQSEAEKREAGILYMPLKGAVLRTLYPKPYLRTSCDTDYLLPKEECDRAVSLLTDKGGYTVLSATPHDVAVGIRGQVTLELHSALFEERDRGAVCPSPFEGALTEGESARRAMHPDYLLFYHIAHMAKHFSMGGCGLPPLVDLWLLERGKTLSGGAIELLRLSGLYRFYRAMHALSLSYLEGAPFDEGGEELHEYLLTGGLYGERERRLALAEEKKGGRRAYFLARVFPPKKTLEKRYPTLEKRPYLYPYYACRRLLSYLSSSDKKSQLSTLPKEQRERERALFESLGL